MHGDRRQPGLLGNLFQRLIQSAGGMKSSGGIPENISAVLIRQQLKRKDTQVSACHSDVISIGSGNRSFCFAVAAGWGSKVLFHCQL